MHGCDGRAWIFGDNTMSYVEQYRKEMNCCKIPSNVKQSKYIGYKSCVGCGRLFK